MTKDTSTQEDQSGAKARRARGEFVRGVSGFRHAIGSAGFPAEPGRYHLFVALNCPWCHRVTLARNVLGLQDSITLDVAFPNRTDEADPEGPNLWEFAPDRVATLTGKPLPECTVGNRHWARSAFGQTDLSRRRVPRTIRSDPL